MALFMNTSRISYDMNEPRQTTGTILHIHMTGGMVIFFRKNARCSCVFGWEKRVVMVRVE